MGCRFGLEVGPGMGESDWGYGSMVGQRRGRVKEAQVRDALRV